MESNDYEFDISKWLPRFPLESYRPDKQITSEFGPARICFREQICHMASEQYDLGRTVPTDVFILAWGEPDSRDVTKMGGLPYRPSEKEWPRSPETGEPLTFTAQFRFTESRDIIPPLPGDVLLCFFESEFAFRYDYFEGRPVFEWYPLGLEDLISLDDLPQPAFEVPLCYGLRYRTVDYADPKAVEILRRVVPKYLIELWGEDSLVFPRSLCQLCDFKIGGVPLWEDPAEAAAQQAEPGPLLAAIPSVRGSCEAPWPWANQEHEVWHGALSWGGESGTVYLFLDDEQTVQPRFQP